ncbi:hypothetical protein ABTX15_15885 [Micromonospora sp. NPDC094482]
MGTDQVRVGLVAPGTVDTEVASRLRDGVREAVMQQIGDLEL